MREQRAAHMQGPASLEMSAARSGAPVGVARAVFCESTSARRLKVLHREGPHADIEGGDAACRVAAAEPPAVALAQGPQIAQFST